MRKRIAAGVLLLTLCLSAGCAAALDMTGLETEALGRDWSQNLFFERMEALTGIAVTAAGVEDEKEYGNLLAAMEKGDVQTDVLFKAALSREQEQALLDSGALIDLAPLIGQHMPNLSALLAAHPEWLDVISLDDGRIASLPLLNEGERQAMLWINRAWLDKLGIAMPQSLEELTAALTAIRDGDPNGNGRKDEIGADLLGVYEMRWLLPFFGVVADDYNLARDEAGGIVFAPALPQYRAFVELLRAWHEQGVLSDQAFTGTHSAKALDEQNDEAPVVSGMILTMAPYTHVRAEAVTDYEPVFLPGPDGRVRWRDLLGEVWTGCFAVTSRCADAASALAWADALYAEEGALLGYAGLEGEDYVFTSDGFWTYDMSGSGDVSTLRTHVLMYTGTAMPGLYPAGFVKQVDSEMDRHVFEANDRALAIAERVTQPYCLSAEDQERADELAARIGALVDTGIARFATGETELTDENYDAWLAQLKEAGCDELAALFAQAE